METWSGRWKDAIRKEKKKDTREGRCREKRKIWSAQRDHGEAARSRFNTLHRIRFERIPGRKRAIVIFHLRIVSDRLVYRISRSKAMDIGDCICLVERCGEPQQCSLEILIERSPDPTETGCLCVGKRKWKMGQELELNSI